MMNQQHFSRSKIALPQNATKISPPIFKSTPARVRTAP